MKVILLRSWTHAQGKKYPVGTVLHLWHGFAKELISKGIAREYTGEYPPKKKPKINLNTR
jgi:hypothetical protein